MEQPTSRRVEPARPLTLVGMFALSALARGLLLYYRLTIAGVDIMRLGGSDVPGWIGVANHLYTVRDLSYWLLGARPPLFPLSIAVTYALGGSLYHAAMVQALFGALTPVVGYLLARRLLGDSETGGWFTRPASWAGLIMALDLASISASGTLLAEPLFNLLFTACLLSLTIFVQDGGRWHLTVSALWLALAMLTRPTAIYFWVVAPLALIPITRRWRQVMLALAAAGLAVYVGWSAHNLHYYNTFTYYTPSNFTLLFLRALSAEHLATGADTDELQVEYVRTLYQHVGDQEAAARAVPEHFWRFMVVEDPGLYAEMGRLARQKLLQYWPYALLGTGVGAWRMFGETEALPPFLKPVELIYHVLLYGSMLWGVWRAFRRRDWQLLILTSVPILYITGLTLASQTSAMDTRMRTPITAPLAILAAYGLGEVIYAKQRSQ